MAVRMKNRRKIIVENKLYVWYVDLDYDSTYYICNIVSADKSLIVSCPMKTETSYIISKGTIFQNLKTDGHWNRYLLPFRIPEIITSKFVSKVILWAMQNKNAIEVKWNGKDVPV